MPPRLIRIIGLSLCLVGCTVKPFVVQPLTLRMPWSSPETQAAAFSADDQALYDMLKKLFEARFDSPVAFPENLEEESSPYRIGARPYRTQAGPTLDAQTTNGFYSGPYPSASSLPDDYQKRPKGGWLAANPVNTANCTTSTTETYWTPDGDKTSPAAYTKEQVSLETGAFTNYLYASPPVAAGLPAYFSSKLSLPAQHTVEQAEETYRTITDGPFKGTAQGYRWAVFDAQQELTAWVRAYQIRQADGTKVDRYVINTDYQKVKGSVVPTRYAYGTYNEATQIGLSFDQRRESTNKWVGTGTWTDFARGRSNSYTERIEANGSRTRTYTYQDAAVTLVTTETYQREGNGTGTVSLNGAQKATMTWDAKGQGTVTFASGSQPYTASLIYPAPGSGDCGGSGKK